VRASAIDEVGVRPADLRPDRAIALVVLSRTTLALMVGLGVWVGHVALHGPSGPDALAIPRASVVLDTAGTDHAGLLEGVVESVRGAGGRVIELDVGAHVTRRAPVRLRVELPGRGAGEVDRLVRRVEAAGLEDVTPQGVTPVAGGVVLEIAGAVWLRGALGAEVRTDARAELVVLSDIIERSGARLRRLELLNDGSGVRLDVAGTTGELVALVATLEKGSISPLDLRSFRFRERGDDGADLDLVFGIRSAGSGGTAGGQRVSG
jgi:hypothetical protein